MFEWLHIRQRPTGTEPGVADGPSTPAHLECPTMQSGHKRHIQQHCPKQCSSPATSSSCTAEPQEAEPARALGSGAGGRALD